MAQSCQKVVMNERLDWGGGTGAANDRLWVLPAAKLPGRKRPSCGHLREVAHDCPTGGFRDAFSI